MLGHVAPIDDQDVVVFAQRLVDQAVVGGQDRAIVPRARADELLEGAYSLRRLRPRAAPAQCHRLHVLAWDIREQQATQVDIGPGAPLTALKEGREVGMVRGQFVSQVGHMGGVSVSASGASLVTSSASSTTGIACSSL